MNVLVCVKRVPETGARITLTPDAQAIDTTLLSLNRDQLKQFINENPKAALHIITVLGKRQRETRKQRGSQSVAFAQGHDELKRQLAAPVYLDLTQAPINEPVLQYPTDGV